jgi:hypothetical protein
LKNATKKAPAVKAAPAKKEMPKRRRREAMVVTLAGTTKASDPKPVEPAADPAPKAKRLSPKEKREAIARGESPRITQGAKIETWRLRRSQRTGLAGWFVQGGFNQQGAKGSSFVVGRELYFTEHEAAKAAYAEATGKAGAE